MHVAPDGPRTARIAVAATLVWLVVAAAACGSELDPPAAGDGVRKAAVRTVVLVTIDTLRADFLGAYGSKLASTPAFDALAARGALFERAIAASSSTIPSHATMLTGLPPRRHSAGARNGDTRLAGATTVAQHFQQEGWQTAAFVSNAVLQRRSGLASGFARYDQNLPEREEFRVTFERRAPETVEAALHWLGKHEDQPVFLWVHLQDPHGPYTPPSEWVDKIPVPESPGADEVRLEVKTWDNPIGGIPAYQALDGLDRPSQYTRRYAAEIAYTDAALGQLIEGLNSRGDSAIVLTADHGESLGEADRWFQHGHTSTIDLARIPLLVVAPGIEPQRRPELVGHVDVAPTLLDLAGLPPLGSSEFGLSLSGPLRNRSALPDRTLFCDSTGEASAYRLHAHVRADGFGARTAAQAIESLESGDATAVRFSGSAADAAGEWAPIVDRSLARELADYLRGEVAITPATPNRETLERLRALGYLGTPQQENAGDLAPELKTTP